MLPILESPQLDFFTDWISSFVIHQAHIAPFILLFMDESGIPLPIPGEAYITYVGYEVSRGQLSYILAFLMLLASVLLGASILYFVSRRWGRKLVLKIGKYIHVDEKRLTIVEGKFKKYGFWVIIFGRHIPGFRIPITIFSGISGVPYTTFIVSTFISVVFWIALYLSVGEKVGIKVVKHFHISPLYFLILSIPFILFVISIISVWFGDIQSRRKKA
jgi:membrane protein DedA with SNARE-associated domain